MNTTNITNTERISRKDYRKAVRKAIRTKRAKAKAAAAQKKASLPKEYDILARFDCHNESLVKEAIKKNNFKPDMITSEYVWIRKADAKTFDKFKEVMLECAVTVKGKVHKVSISGFKPNTVVKKEKPKKTPTHNTEEVRRAAHVAKKARNIARHLRAHEHKLLRDEQKKSKMAGKNAKLFTYSEKVQGIVRMNNNCNNPMSKAQKTVSKLRKKAQQIIAATTQKKSVRMAGNSPKKVKFPRKSRQLTIDFNKAA